MSKFNSECSIWRIRTQTGSMSYGYFDITRPNNFSEEGGVVTFYGMRHKIVQDDDEDLYSGTIPVLEPIGGI